MSTVSFLSDADDLVTRVLFDLCIFAEPGRRTAKMDPNIRETRFKGDELQMAEQLVKDLRKAKITAAEATSRFCGLPCIKSFQTRWKNEVAPLQHHVRRYLEALRPESGVAFHETDRYTKPIKTAKSLPTPSPTPPPSASTSKDAVPSFIDVAVFATRAFKKGEVIQLKGGTADLDDDADDELRASGYRADFSVLWSARRNSFALLLGPARFVNHDCRNNVEFQLQATSMSFKVVEDIEEGEQLFTHYGEHYFDTDNSACLCSTCEQLKRGAFAPLIKSSAVPKPDRARAAALFSPHRRSSRAVPTPAGAGHELTATRSVSRTSSTRSSSLSSLSRRSSSSSSSSASTADKRRSIRTVPVIDEFRTRKRLVHPRLKPPAGYKDEYRWDARARTGKYIGLSSVPVVRPPSKSQPSTSKVALGKRKRVDSSSDESSDDSSDEEVTPRPTMRSDRAKRVAKRAVKKRPPPAIGIRTSARSGALLKTASGRETAFVRLAKFLGFEDDSELTDASESESELSELDTSEDGKGEEDKKGEELAKMGEEEKTELVEEELVEAARGVVEGSLVEVVVATPVVASMDLDAEEADDERFSADDFSPPTPPNERPIRPLPRRSPSPDPDDDLSPELDIILVPVPQTPSPSRANGLFAAVAADSTDLSPAADGESQAGRSGAREQQQGGGEQQAEESNAGASGDGEQATAGPSESGGAGGDGKEDKDDDRPKKDVVGDGAEVEVEEEKVEEEKVEEEKVEEKGEKVDKGKAVELSATAGGDGDEVDSEAAALLLLMFGGPDSKDEDEPVKLEKPFNMTTATSYGSSPDTTPPSPPKPGSSAASVGSTEALDPATILDSKKGKKRSRASDAPEVDSRPPSLARSTRRNSLLERASPSPPPARLTANRRIPKPLSRTSNSLMLSDSPKPAEASTSSLEKLPTTSVPDKKPRLPQLERARSTSASASPKPQSEASEARGTRRSAPLQGGLRDLLASPAVTAVAGGYDPVSRRYINKRVKSRSPSPEPEPEPLELPAVRGTRRSQPLEGDIRSLLASPSVAAVAGGFDARSGKYFSRKGDGDGQRKPKKSFVGSSAGSGGEASPAPVAARAPAPVPACAVSAGPAPAPAPAPALAAAASLARLPPPSPPRSNIRWGKPSLVGKGAAAAAGGAFAKKMEEKEEGH